MTLKVDLLGQIAKGTVHSPSHKIRTEASEGGMTVFLESNAVLDRNFVLNLDGLAEQSFAQIAPDGDEYMVLASFSPDLPAKDAPLLLKILVDCSGSMSGNSIESAKYALGSVIKELKANDYIS